MKETEDLSKLSSDEIIVRLVKLQDVCVTPRELKAAAHVLTVILKQAVIREASVAECNLDVAQGYPYVCVRGSIDTFHSLKNGEYHLVPKETP